MDKKQFDNKIFSAEESPIPVIQPDDAWAAMRQQLDREQTVAGIIIRSLRSERPRWTSLQVSILVRDQLLPLKH